MTKTRGLLLLSIAAALAIIAILWFKGRGSGDKSAAQQGATRGSSQVTVAPKSDDKPEPARAHVTVTGDKGPLAAANVRFAKEGEVTVVQTGTDGVARAELEPGKWAVSASAEGFEPNGLEARELRAGETAKLELALKPGGRALTGLVTDVSGGAIAGARIDAARLADMAGPSDAVATTVTGADGRYKLSVAEGQLLVAASEASYAPQSRYVEVGAAGATADFQLVPGGVIEGVVRDERTREPVPGARVEARRDTAAMMLGESARRRAVAGADGRFRFTGLRPGAYALGAQAPKLASIAPTLVGLGVAEQVTDVEILVAGAPVIRGLVLDENGKPAPDVEVNAFSGPGEGAQATSDANGKFAIEGLSTGEYMLMGRSDTFLPAGTTRVELARSDVDDVKVNVQRGLRIKGHVEPRQVCEVELEASGDPMTEMPMMFSAKTTAADGQFDLGPVRPGAFEIRARCPSGDQGTKEVKAAAGMAEVIVEVKPGASIAGRVVDGSGKPVAAVTVMAVATGETERTTIVNGRMVGGVQALTDAKGEYELRGLSAGKYRLRVLDRGQPLPQKSREPELTLAATDKKTGVVLTVERPDGVIRGVVTGPDGKPLADAWVSLHQGIEDMLANADRGSTASSTIAVRVDSDDNDDGGGGFAPVLTDAAGKFEIRNLPRVPWTVIAEADAGKLRGRANRVVPDANITIQALGVTELKGIVKAAPMPTSFNVELDGPTRAARSFASADGSFSFGRVDPGEYVVRVSSSAGNGKATVKVEAGKPATVEIQLVANAVVIGKLVDGAGKPMGGLPVAVVADSGDGRMRVEMSGPPPTSNPDGTFRVEAKAGPSVLLVMVPPRPVTKRGLQLEPGKTFDAGAITVEAAPPPPPP